MLADAPPRHRPLDDPRLVAGDLALDFVNTVGYRLDPSRSDDKLTTLEDVARWMGHAGLPDPQDWLARVRRDRRALAATRRVREDLYALFRARIDRAQAPADALARVESLLDRCHRARVLVDAGPMLAWRWDRRAVVDELLYPIVLAALALLTAPRGDAIACCEGQGCGWLFLDTSPTRRRRWCSMDDCGNRAKARAYYRRHAPPSGREA